MFKKILSLAIVAMMLMGLVAISVSAAESDVADVAADSDVAAQGAEADVAATGAGVIKFDAASAGWSDASSVLFYIHEIGGSELGPWGSKKKLGGTDEGNGIWSFDAAALGVVEGKSYGIIFNNYDSNAETYDLLLDTSCFGDTAYVPDTSKLIENPVDSNKKSMEARWKSNSNGPLKQITSIGSIVGESIPSTTTPYAMLVKFLASKGKDGLTNALNFNGKDAQTTIDEVAAALGLTQADVTKAIEEAKTTGNTDTGDKCDWSDKWDASKSSLPAGSSDSGSSGNTTGGSTTTTGGSTTTTGGSTTSGGSSTTKSGSGGGSQTGQESTVIFIMLGVMVAAAGVVFFLRRKERA